MIMSENFVTVIALLCCFWGLGVWVVQGIGIYKIFKYYSEPPPKPVSPSLPQHEVPHVTIIRPVKGLEPGLYECLASTCRQEYPRDKLTIYLCVESARDAAFSTLQQIMSDFPDINARVFVEEEDPVLHGPRGSVGRLGPNPKIRNISRAYREAQDGAIWIVDCNVWLSKGVAGRMVDMLYGFCPQGGRTKPYKFVHNLPLVVDIGSPMTGEDQSLLHAERVNSVNSGGGNGGSALDEMFMATTHAKFYSAINAVGVAPCIVGKSNMFRKSHLDLATDPQQNPLLSAWEVSRGRGIDFFSSYICEDHLVGDLLWRTKIPGFRKHGLVLGDLAIQPSSNMSLAAYFARRVRWLRVRKWTVLVATLVEPGVESLLDSLYLSFGLTTLPYLNTHFGLPKTWSAMGLTWLLIVTAWMLVDRQVYLKLHKCQSVEADENTPLFARGIDRKYGLEARPFGNWVVAWLGREFLALPIWVWAVLLGTTVSWRGKQFQVAMDMSVREINPPRAKAKGQVLARSNGSATTYSRSKDRLE